MPIVTTNLHRKVFRKATSMVVIPYVTSPQGYSHLGDTAYDLSAIIGDSITIEQNSGEEQTKENEFVASPIVKNVTVGEWKFSAQCLDLQDAVLKVLFNGYYSEATGVTALRDDYTEMYALVRVRFADADTPDVWMPKVALNSNLLLGQLSSRGAQGNISGTLMPTTCAVAETDSGLAKFSADEDEVYDVYTPLLFAPQGRRVLVIDHTEGDTKYFDEVGDLSEDEIVRSVKVSASTPGNFTS